MTKRAFTVEEKAPKDWLANGGSYVVVKCDSLGLVGRALRPDRNSGWNVIPPTGDVFAWPKDYSSARVCEELKKRIKLAILGAMEDIRYDEDVAGARNEFRTALRDPATVARCKAAEVAADHAKLEGTGFDMAALAGDQARDGWAGPFVLRRKADGRLLRELGADSYDWVASPADGPTQFATMTDALVHPGADVFGSGESEVVALRDLGPVVIKSKRTGKTYYRQHDGQHDWVMFAEEEPTQFPDRQAALAVIEAVKDNPAGYDVVPAYLVPFADPERAAAARR